jgi:hypothetical protein
MNYQRVSELKGLFLLPHCGLVHNSMVIWKLIPYIFHFFILISNNMETKKIKQKSKPDPKLKLMDQVRQVLRYHHYSYSSERTYCEWIVRFIKFHGGKTLAVDPMFRTFFPCC